MMTKRNDRGEMVIVKRVLVVDNFRYGVYPLLEYLFDSVEIHWIPDSTPEPGGVDKELLERALARGLVHRVDRNNVASVVKDMDAVLMVAKTFEEIQDVFEVAANKLPVIVAWDAEKVENLWEIFNIQFKDLKINAFERLPEHKWIYYLCTTLNWKIEEDHWKKDLWDRYRRGYRWIK